ncbi:MAG: hypothetical protein M1355_01925 [Patescibacteria group bacterium]|nr:hypothetical protein [Patescibacteria group bacterium]
MAEKSSLNFEQIKDTRNLKEVGKPLSPEISTPLREYRMGDHEDWQENYQNLSEELKKYILDQGLEERHKENIGEAKRVVSKMKACHSTTFDSLEQIFEQGVFLPNYEIKNSLFAGKSNTFKEDRFLDLDLVTFCRFGKIPHFDQTIATFLFKDKVLERKDSSASPMDIADLTEGSFVSWRSLKPEQAIELLEKFKKFLVPANKIKELMADSIAAFYEKPSDFYEERSALSPWKCNWGIGFPEVQLVKPTIKDIEAITFHHSSLFYEDIKFLEEQTRKFDIQLIPYEITEVGTFKTDDKEIFNKLK